MKFLSIELSGFIPLSHTGRKYIKIEFHDRVTAILGNNGYGKSSILRELTPYPPVRTDFAKNGFCVKTISHENSTYVLTSDFRNSGKAHSFTKDGVELNESGSTEVQRELCDSVFKYNSVLDDLSSGKYKVCDMVRSGRRALFMATYPSDLSFILDHYKSVCSQIRVYNNNLKMLREREYMLKGKLLEAEQLSDLRRYHLQLSNFSNDLDKMQLTLENDSRRFSEGSEYRKYLDREHECMSFEEWQQKCSDLKLKIYELKNLYGDIFYQDRSITETSIRSLIGTIATRVSESNSLETRIETLRNELTELESIKDVDSEKEIATVTDRIHQLEKLIAHPCHPEMEIPEHRLAQAEQDLKRLDDLCNYFHGLTFKLWSRQEIQVAERDLEDRITLSNIAARKLEDNEKTLAYLYERQSKEQSRQVPIECRLVCSLKSAVQAMHKRTQDEIDILLTERAKNQEVLKTHQPVIEQLKEDVQCRNTGMPYIEQIYDILSQYSVVKNIINGESLISVLNEHPYDIRNKFEKIIQDNYSFIAYRKAVQERETCQAKLKALEAIRAVSKGMEFISKTIYEKQTELTTNIDSYKHRLEDIRQSEAVLAGLKHADACVQSLQQLATEYELISAVNWLNTRLSFNKMILDEIRSVKSVVESKRLEIESTIREQDSLLTRLMDEIVPNITKIEDELKDWTAVEKELSPNDGIPHNYIVRYINRIILKVNSYIKQVWLYDMELMYLDEDKPLDYSIQVLIGKSSVIKDLNILSNGQKAMVDLAFILAVCIDRKYSTNYPIRMDEVDPALTEHHRARLASLISEWVSGGDLMQLFLVNHFVVHTGISNCEVVALSTEGIVVPPVYNQHVILK